MNKTVIIIDGDNFSSLAKFYEEIEAKFTRDLGWKIGRNLHAFNDVLRGGFGVYEYDERIGIIWNNSGKSKNDLSYKETIKYIELKLQTCHPENIESVKRNLELARQYKGETLFEMIVNIIHTHGHISLTLT